jgi:hypothetical protein
MKDYFISINQLAEFSSATLASKKRIIKQQKVPDKLLIPWYQLAKGAAKKLFRNIHDYSPILEAIEKLTISTPKNNRQRIDREVSLEALEILKHFKFPEILKGLNYDTIVTAEKAVFVDDVRVIVAPEIIIRTQIDGKYIYGGIKLHVCKSKPFNFDQASYVATALHKFLTEKVARNEEIVNPDLCFCFDIFSQRLTSASNNIPNNFKNIKSFCSEVRELWLAA